MREFEAPARPHQAQDRQSFQALSWAEVQNHATPGQYLVPLDAGQDLSEIGEQWTLGAKDLESHGESTRVPDALNCWLIKHWG